VTAVDEARWLRSSHPSPMLKLLTAQGQCWHRKLRLAACAAVRRAWDWLPEDYRALVEVVEAYADGEAPVAALTAAWPWATPDADDRTVWAVSAAVHAAHTGIGFHVENCLLKSCAAVAGSRAAKAAELAAQAHLLRDVFGLLPFRPVVADPLWRTRDVTALAETIYRERAFAELPALADALEDAGCADEAFLSHLRGPGPHARGCWAVDLLLGRG
jgi:hypothetical protein